MPAVACFAGAHCSLSVTAYVRVLVEQDGTRYGMGRMERGDTWCRSNSQSVLSGWLQLPPGCCVLLTSGPTTLELGPTRLRSLLEAFIQEPRFVRPNTKCGHFV